MQIVHIHTSPSGPVYGPPVVVHHALFLPSTLARLLQIPRLLSERHFGVTKCRTWISRGTRLEIQVQMLKPSQRLFCLAPSTHRADIFAMRLVNFELDCLRCSTATTRLTGKHVQSDNRPPADTNTSTP